jgi:pyruvate,water dikinase
MSDFKTNEYARLSAAGSSSQKKRIPCLDGTAPAGTTARTIAKGFGGNTALPAGCVKKSDCAMSQVMIPFCRTLWEADKNLQVVADNGLRRGENGLEV